jgi:hypothetical protein
MTRNYTLQYLTVSLLAAPGVGNTYTVVVLKNGANPSPQPTVTITGVATTGQDTTNSFTGSAFDLIVVRVTPSSNFGGTTIYASYELVM